MFGTDRAGGAVEQHGDERPQPGACQQLSGRALSSAAELDAS
jgi:hypothetical protein